MIAAAVDKMAKRIKQIKSETDKIVKDLLERSEQYEFEPNIRCRICKQIGKMVSTKYADEGYITELFICECGHQEVL